MLQRLRTDASVRQGQWVALPEVSAALRQALLLSEDRRFTSTAGGLAAVSAAAWGNVWNARTRVPAPSPCSWRVCSTKTGARAPADAAWRRSWERRWRRRCWSVVGARTKSWRPTSILVPFRGEVVGIDALARTALWQGAHGLDAQRPHWPQPWCAPNAHRRRCRNVPASGARCSVHRRCPRRLAPARQLQRPRPRRPIARAGPAGHAALQRRAWPASEGVARTRARQLRAGAGQQGGQCPLRRCAPRSARRCSVLRCRR